MGDLTHASQPLALETAATGFARDGNQGLAFSSPSPYKPPDNAAPFYSQLSAIPHNQHRPDHRSVAQSSSQYPVQDYGASQLNMSSMAGALPEYSSVDDMLPNPHAQQSLPRSTSGASTAIYHPGHNMQMAAYPSPGMSSHNSYGAGFVAGPYQQTFAPAQGPQQTAYSPYAANQSLMIGRISVQTTYQGYPQASQYMYYPEPYGVHGQFAHGYPAHGLQGQRIYDRRTNIPTAQLGDNLQNNGFTGNRRGPGGTQDDTAAMGSMFTTPFARSPGMSSQGTVNSIPRGPPRKPKQSGHALWVGNLPPGTTVVDLKEHFSREATEDIESLFLISKSNCAFVNYRTEAACTAAMHRFHDSRFNGVRLVCRLRRSSTPASGVPTGPSAMMSGHHVNVSPDNTPRLDGDAVDGLPDGATTSAAQNNSDENSGAPDPPSKYFIVKSLTLQDLELSVRNGIWATQSHNEDVLNKAFRSTQNVYLIFSANKSGEYFGYARMTSPILEDTSHPIAPTPKTEPFNDAPDVPRSIPTPATEWAPRGKIIDDSARGTIFWEAELSPSDPSSEPATETQPDGETDTAPVAQSWGKPFNIEWVSTTRLPFYRTRGLRNPWNANREVKIARDGTELEPSVGERLVQMFHRVGPSAAVAPMMSVQGQMGGMRLY